MDEPAMDTYVKCVCGWSDPHAYRNSEIAMAMLQRHLISEEHLTWERGPGWGHG